MKNLLLSMLALGMLSCGGPVGVDANSVADNAGQVQRVEPLSWWVGMQTPLQLLVQGDRIAECDVAMAQGSDGVRITGVHKADSPNYLFVDVEVKASADAGTYYLIFARGDELFKVAYELEARDPQSRDRKSFTNADMVYLIMPDRFADGDPSIDSTASTIEKSARGEFFGRHGGDIRGIMNNLDYIADLGATAIWCTPLLLDNEPQGSYHGYACADYYHIDPRYGSNELFRDYVEECHERDLKVIMDIVTNHCGVGHWWMQDLPFADWIHQHAEYLQTNNLFSSNMDPNASKHDLQVQESGWFDHSMPDMNLDNPFLLQYFKQWTVWWIEYAGLDGLRVDTYPYNEKVPMSEWCEAVVAEYPNMNIVGECWTDNVPQLAYWQGGNSNRDGFDSKLPSIMDFPLRSAICSALPTDSLRWGEGMIKVYDALSNDFVYHDLSKIFIFAGNHDTDRIGDVVRKNPERAKLAMALLSTMRGTPQIFAGDEMMFTSKDLSQGHGGLRVDFPGGWAADQLNLFDPTQRDSIQTAVFDYTKRLFNWRKTKEVIHSGRTLHFAGRDNTYAYFRYNDAEAVFVFVNNSRGAKSVPWSNYSEITGSLSRGRDVISGVECEISDATLVKPRQALIVEFERRAK